MLGISRSAQYYEPKVVKESELEAAIYKVCAQFPRYGYRRVTAELNRRGWQVNRKRIARLTAKLNLQARKPAPRKCRTTDSNHPYPRYPNLVDDLQVERPDQVWVADITYIRLGIYLSGGVDGRLYSRYSRLALGSFARPVVDAGGFVQSLGNPLPGNPSF
jgi:putative transposase